MEQVVFGSRIITPCKIVCVGRNYVAHIRELGNEIPSEPVYFIKPNSAIGGELVAREGLHYEAEICFLIQDKKIAGVGFGLDLTRRDIQSQLKAKGLPWERAKAFRGAALFSEFVACEDWEGLSVRLYKNGTLVQEGGVELMIYKPNFLVHDIEQIFGLDDGDIIMSGTPKGVGEVVVGDYFVGQIYLKKRLIAEGEWRAYGHE